MGGGRLAIGLAALALAAPAAAGATTYCVHQSGTCDASQTDEGGDLQKAMTDASANAGSTILIGAGTYQHDNGFLYYNLASPVTIIGAGAGQVTIESTAAHPATYVLTFGGPAAATLSGVTVHVSAADASGAALTGVTADGIAVTTATGGPGNQAAVRVENGATVEHSTIQGETADGCCPQGVWATSGAATLLDDTIVATEPIQAAGASADLTVRDSRLTGFIPVAVFSQASVTIDGLLASAQNGTGVLVTSGSTATVRSATIVNADPTKGTGLSVTAGSAHSSLTVDNSIVRGFANAFSRDGTGGAADLTVNYDDLTGAESSGGPGTYTNNSDINADPLFLNAAAGDYHLLFGSPAIDSGGACLTICQTVPDLDGLTRPIDGNGDGNAIRDMGAYEYGHRAPAVVAAGTPATPAVGQPVQFTATASDPDPGDTVGPLTWSFDDGAAATGAAVAHAFATPGVHHAVVTATDVSGLQGSATVAVTVPAPVVPDTTPPAVGTLHLSHRTFRRGTLSARAARKRSPTGTTISFALSENATVKVTFAKRDRHGHYRTVSGRSVRLALKAGTPRIRFYGVADHRHRLSVGAYRMTLLATDAAGNRSTARTAKFTIVSR